MRVRERRMRREEDKSQREEERSQREEDKSQREGYKTQSVERSQREEDKCVFVSNLHSCVKEEILFELFLQAGPVKKVVIPKDREGHQRSFGFVTYKHAEAVPYAVELLDGIWLYGRPLTLKYAFGNSHQVSAAPSQTLNGASGMNMLLPPQGEHSWTNMMSALPMDHFSPLLPFCQGQFWPAVFNATAPLWPWLDSRCVSWFPGVDPQSTMSKTNPEHSLENRQHRKRRSYGRRLKRERRRKV
ncbi:RNA binding motif protein 11 [Hoplias malabaricus]|uniref:RNA binding motif protein 11 n=1 Tax=Hoplias malabaricus TaxID=27720 RepID=UPI003462B1A4